MYIFDVHVGEHMRCVSVSIPVCSALLYVQSSVTNLLRFSWHQYFASMSVYVITTYLHMPNCCWFWWPGAAMINSLSYFLYIKWTQNRNVFLTVHHKYRIISFTNFNAQFLYSLTICVTLQSSTCFEHQHANLQVDKLYYHSIWYRHSL